MKTSQKQNILRHLLYGPLCGQEQDWTLGRRFPARIHELRQTGFQIGKRRCDQGHDHQTPQWEFYLDYVEAKNWCADCGPGSALYYTHDVPKYEGDMTWLPVACEICGKGDWR